MIRGFPDSTECAPDAPSCFLDDGRTACRCVSRPGEIAGHLECEGPPPPPRMYCPADLDPASSTRVSCDPIGESCVLSGGAGRCACIEDDLRDPARPVGYWSCERAVTDPPPPAGDRAA